MKVSLISEIGLVRQENEDAILSMTSKKAGLFAIADGMGGHANGKFASQQVIEALKSWWHENSMEIEQLEIYEQYIFESLKTKIDQVNQDVINHGKLQNCLMGTTLSVLFIYDSRYYVLHVGDSRIYHLNKLQLYQLTTDDTKAYVDYLSGQIDFKTYEECQNNAAITKCVGAVHPICYQYYSGVVYSNDLFVLTSDGTHAYFTRDNFEQRISSWSKGRKNKQEKILNSLKTSILDQGARDNFSCILVAP